MTYKKFELLDVRIENRAAWVTINNPPINLFDMPLMLEMDQVATQLEGDDAVSVVVLQSKVPDFFIAHADINFILAAVESGEGFDPENNFFYTMTERFRRMPKVTIGKIDGIARGGGLELLAALDMRFCSLENTTLAQPELALGFTPGGGGVGRWPAIIGTARAMELILGGRDFSGEDAERYGLVNRALPSSELDEYVDGLATRMASFPPLCLERGKSVVHYEGSIENRMKEEGKAFFETVFMPEASAAMKAFMKKGGQTRDLEIGDAFN